MKKTHPKQYNYCIKKLKLGEVLDYIGVKYQEVIETVLSRVDEIVQLAKEYISKYNLTEKEAIERAISDIQNKIEKIERGI